MCCVGWKGTCPSDCSREGRGASAPALLLCLVETGVPEFPVPAPAVPFRLPQHRHVAPRRQPYQQLQPPAAPLQGEHILSGMQKTEMSPADTQQAAVPAAAAPSGPQAYRSCRAVSCQRYRQAAQQPGRKGTQILGCLPSVTQAEGFPLLKPAYRSSLALTRYWPAVTPPNRYIPWVLVLVTATRVSVCRSPSPVT